MNMRTIGYVAWGLVAISGLAVAWFAFIAPRMDQGVADTLGQGDYQLVTTDGTPFTSDTLDGAPSAVFFGFTHCPDVCPTTLGDVTLWQGMLADEGLDPLRTYVVTIDPERDTVEALADYVSWAPGVVGVTGSQEEIAKAIRAFRVYARKVPLEGGGYTMDHSSLVLLFDENGRFFEPVGYQEDVTRVMSKLRRLMG